MTEEAIATHNLKWRELLIKLVILSSLNSNGTLPGLSNCAIGKINYRSSPLVTVAFPRYGR